MFVIITVKWIPRAFPLHMLKLLRVKLEIRSYETQSILCLPDSHIQNLYWYLTIFQQNCTKYERIIEIGNVSVISSTRYGLKCPQPQVIVISVHNIIHNKSWLYVFTVTRLQFLHNFCITLFTLTTVLRLCSGVLSGIFN